MTGTKSEEILITNTLIKYSLSHTAPAPRSRALTRAQTQSSAFLRTRLLPPQCGVQPGSRLRDQTPRSNRLAWAASEWRSHTGTGRSSFRGSSRGRRSCLSSEASTEWTRMHSRSAGVGAGDPLCELGRRRCPGAFGFPGRLGWPR